MKFGVFFSADGARARGVLYGGRFWMWILDLDTPILFFFLEHSVADTKNLALIFHLISPPFPAFPQPHSMRHPLPPFVCSSPQRYTHSYLVCCDSPRHFWWFILFHLGQRWWSWWGWVAQIVCRRVGGFSPLCKRERGLARLCEFDGDVAGMCVV